MSDASNGSSTRSPTAEKVRAPGMNITFGVLRFTPSGASTEVAPTEVSPTEVSPRPDNQSLLDSHSGRFVPRGSSPIDRIRATLDGDGPLQCPITFGTKDAVAEKSRDGTKDSVAESSRDGTKDAVAGTSRDGTKDSVAESSRDGTGVAVAGTSRDGTSSGQFKFTLNPVAPPFTPSKPSTPTPDAGESNIPAARSPQASRP